MKFQRGLSMNALMMGGVVIAVGSLLLMKALPPWMEYGTLVKTIKATAADVGLKDAPMAQVRAAFTRRAEMDDIKSVTAQDLDITKEGGELVISFAYSKKIPLMGNASLIFDFEGSSAKQ